MTVLLLCTEMSQRRWFSDEGATWMPCGGFFQTHPAGRISSGGTPRTRSGIIISHLAWNCLGISQEGLEEESREKEYFACPDILYRNTVGGFSKFVSMFLSSCKLLFWLRESRKQIFSGDLVQWR